MALGDFVGYLVFSNTTKTINVPCLEGKTESWGTSNTPPTANGIYNEGNADYFTKVYTDDLFDLTYDTKVLTQLDSNNGCFYMHSFGSTGERFGGGAKKGDKAEGESTLKKTSFGGYPIVAVKNPSTGEMGVVLFDTAKNKANIDICFVWSGYYRPCNIPLSSEPVSSDLKPVYKRVNGEWVKQTAYERKDGEWVLISSEP